MTEPALIIRVILCHLTESLALRPAFGRYLLNTLSQHPTHCAKSYYTAPEGIQRFSHRAVKLLTQEVPFNLCLSPPSTSPLSSVYRGRDASC